MTWGMNPDERARWFGELLNGFTTRVSESNYYACVKLERPLDAKTKHRLLVSSAKAKLSKEELEALLKEGKS